jgi:Type I phosphodiesterase / nucleotide pyrophosphatase
MAPSLPMTPSKASGAGGSRLLAVLFAVVVVAEAWSAVIRINSFPVFSSDAGKLLLWHVLFLGVPAGVLFFALMWAARRLFGEARQAAAAASAVTLVLLQGAFAALVHWRFYAWLDLFRDHLVLQAVLAGWILACLLLEARRATMAEMVAAALAVAACVAGIGGAPTAQQVESQTRALRSTQPPHGGLIVVIGVDGLSWETLQRWPPSEDFAWLRKRAYFGPLRTIRPTASPEIWTTIATGGAPRDHGVIGFRGWQFDGLTSARVRVPRLLTTRAWAHLAERLGVARQPLISSFDVRMRPVWDVFAQNGQTIASIGWWASWPAQPTNGFIVSDKFYFFRDAAFEHKGEADFNQGMTYPPRLLEQIEPLRERPEAMPIDTIADFLGKQPQEIEHLPRVENFRPAWFDPISELRFGYTLDRTHTAIALEFLKAQPPLGFLGVYLRGVDIVSHAAMCHSKLYPECEVSLEGTVLYGELVSRYYADTFTRVRRIVEAAGEDALVMIVSDHGFAPEGPDVMDHHFGPPGVLMVTGAALDAKLDPPPSVFDVAPTLLWLKGFPAADDMPGRALTELFPRPNAATLARLGTYGYRAPDAVVGAGQVGQTDAEMMRLLRTLGYIK